MRMGRYRPHWLLTFFVLVIPLKSRFGRTVGSWDQRKRGGGFLIHSFHETNNSKIQVHRRNINSLLQVSAVNCLHRGATASFKTAITCRMYWCYVYVLFYVLLTVYPCTTFFKWSQLGAHYFLVYLFQLLYMFRAIVCPSSGELTVSTRHWYFLLCVGGCPVCRQSEKYQCRVDKVSSPDDGHTVARNM